ncbi:MAG: LURP-one-related family protein [Ruminococcus sp.]|uniref:LURP-one-related/scramblase family protein n=1 Tax=Ruminococcus sp. TaxID=41978 RepID=UPI0025DB731D|nr:LURP-one-related family protein [Ruminococcus sp.]MCR5600240.1 LURP-one-related family protein [Ruminococcus sp.]
MKLYFKQKVFTIRQRSEIMDEYGNVLFTAVGEISIGRRMHIYDKTGNEMAFIQQRLLRLMPRFSVYMGGNHVADIVRNFTFFSQDYRIEGLGWKVSGDWLAHDYTITFGGRYIASIHKHWMTWGDSFEVDIADGEDYVMVLAVIIAIDCVIDNSN